MLVFEGVAAKYTILYAFERRNEEQNHASQFQVKTKQSLVCEPESGAWNKGAHVSKSCHEEGKGLKEKVQEGVVLPK